VFSDSVNIWDHENEGNYWSDYTGQDLDRDGIGETTYTINDYNRDRHPLIGMFSDFKVILGKETYHLTTICNSTISEFRFEIGPETRSQIIVFNVTGVDNTVGFCRVMIPTQLMAPPYIVLVDIEEISPPTLIVSNETVVSNETYVYLSFTYIHSSHNIKIISSETQQLYYELLDKYYELLDKYNELLDNYVTLQIELHNLNATYQGHLVNYSVLLVDYSQLQTSYEELVGSYQGHLVNYSVLLVDYSQLQTSYEELVGSYQDHLLDYSDSINNVRNLMYVLAATTGLFIIITIYLSKQAHSNKTKSLPIEHTVATGQS
jgi:hypothetical protein